MLIVRDVYFSAYDENGEERLYSTTELISEEDYMEKLYAEAAAAEEAKKGAGEKLKSAKSAIVDKAKAKAKGAGKWAKDLAVKGVDAVKAHPVKTAIGATTAVAVPVASVAGYKYYKKHKKACK